MLLATRCPFCETVFRLQPAQLALRGGLVRCGQCQQVFDASGSLFETAEGGGFSTATPLSAAAVAALTSGDSGAAGAHSAPASPKAPSTAPAASTAVPSQLATPQPAAPNPATTQPDTPQPAMPQPAAPQPAPSNFSAAAWDSWALASDATTDTDAHRTANNLPSASVSAEAGAAVASPHDDEPEGPPDGFRPAPVHSSEPFLGATADRATDATRFAANDAPHAWHKVEGALDDPAKEPFLNAPSPLRNRPDGEPRFGAVAAEPFELNPPQHDAEPFPLVRETRAPQPRQVGWVAGGTVAAVVLFVALLAQLAWWQRETVMVYFPRMQTLFVHTCARLGCQVAAPHDIDGLQVEPSDLRQIDGPHKLELRMPLRNRFNLSLAYPAIELTLLDDQNNVAVRRVLYPQDYLAPGTPIVSGLPARTTQTMIVHLDTGPAVASNFRVQIFYP